jgi:hypothetical protein
MVVDQVVPVAPAVEPNPPARAGNEPTIETFSTPKEIAALESEPDSTAPF